jgi:hypothetical protein
LVCSPGFKVEIFARLAAPIDLALAVGIGLYRIVGSAAAMSVRVVEHSNRSLLIGIGPTAGSEVNYPDQIEGALLQRSKQNSAERVIASKVQIAG